MIICTSKHEIWKNMDYIVMLQNFVAIECKSVAYQSVTFHGNNP